MSASGRGTTSGTETAERPAPAPAPAEVRSIREVARPEIDDKGIMDPGQTFTRHMAVLTTGSPNNGALAPQPLGFRSRCVIVDNFSNQYIYLPDGNTWAPPYTLGYRILLVPTDKCEATTGTFGARGTVTQVAPVSTELAVLTWCEKVVLSTPVRLATATP